MTQTSQYRATWLAVLWFALAGIPAQAQVRIEPKDAEPATRAAQDAMAKTLPFADRADFEDANFGFVATLPDAFIAGTGPVWSMKPYAFETGEAPATVNPSLGVRRSSTSSTACSK
jgi:alkyl sulfatase BDS1-like metallo-beta-lactamase superfamily hydrolase